MNLLELIQGDGFILRRVADTDGSEYAGAMIKVDDEGTTKGAPPPLNPPERRLLWFTRK